MGKKQKLKQQQRQQQDLPRASRRDLLLFVVVTLAISLLISTAIPIGCAVSLMGGYHRFIQDLGGSLAYAREHETLELSVDGETRKADPSEGEALYGLLSDTGMGSPLSEAPGGEPLTLSFGDGTSLQLFSTQIEESDGTKVDGLAVCYQRKDGSTFAYDTDRLTYQDVISRIG